MTTVEIVYPGGVATPRMSDEQIRTLLHALSNPSNVVVALPTRDGSLHIPARHITCVNIPRQASR